MEESRESLLKKLRYSNKFLRIANKRIEEMGEEIQQLRKVR